MRLTKQTGHAIRILIDCANAGDNLIKVAEISERLDITKQNVFKIVHILSRAGFISAVRGPSGGVRLGRAPATIRIGDVVRAIEVTHVEIDGEDDSGATNERDSGSINAVFDDAMFAFVAVLDQHTLADLATGRRNLTGEATPRATTTKSSRPKKSAPVRAQRR
ncbi:MAG: Rrf2 family transcriptional regulator [Hyphomicrobium sp.]